MENLLSLLNPKGCQIDGMPRHKSVDAITTADVCTALSYAKLTFIQEQLVYLYVLKNNHIEKIDQAAESIALKLQKPDDVKLIFCALVELCATPAKYKPSQRNRAMITGLSRMQIQRRYGEVINEYIIKFQLEFMQIEGKINNSL